MNVPGLSHENECDDILPAEALLACMSAMRLTISVKRIINSEDLLRSPRPCREEMRLGHKEFKRLWLDDQFIQDGFDDTRVTISFLTSAHKAHRAMKKQRRT